MATDENEKNSKKSEMWSVCLDESKRYFVLRKDANVKPEEAFFSFPKEYAETVFKEICDKYGCGVPLAEHVYCYGCDGLSHGICPDHPLVFVIDCPVRMEADAANTLPKFFYLRRSTIPRAGSGVFTRIFLPAGSVFGPYGGFMVYGDDDKVEPDYSWEIEVPKGKESITVDASDPKRSNYLRWINCARYKEEQNMIVLQYHERMYYVVFKPVYPDQELLVWYGESYANRLAIENIRRSTDLYAPPKAKRDPKAFMSSWIYDKQVK